MRMLPAAGAVAWAALVLGTRLNTIAAIGTHEACHCYLEGDGRTCTARFHGDVHRDLVVQGDAAAYERKLPHVIPRAAGWVAGALMLLPAVILAYVAVSDSPRAGTKEGSH